MTQTKLQMFVKVNDLTHPLLQLPSKQTNIIMYYFNYNLFIIYNLL